MKGAGHSWRIFEAVKRKKYKPGKAIPGCCGRGTKKTKERSEAKEAIVGKRRTGRAKALADDRVREREKKREKDWRREREREGMRRKVRERKRDEGFTAAVMFVGSRNFGVSESREESYLNEPG